MRVRFPHRTRRYRPRRSMISSLGCWIYIFIEGFLTWGWDTILPRCGGTSTMALGSTLAVRWLYQSCQSAISGCGWGFHTVFGGTDPGGHFFVPGLLGLKTYGRISDPGMELCPPRVRQYLDAVPRGKSRSALAPANSRSVERGWVSHLSRLY